MFASCSSVIYSTLVAQMIKKFPAVQKTWVLSLGQEDPLEKGMATDSSILAWKIPWTEEPGRLHRPWGHRVGCNLVTKQVWKKIF